jgi:fermentation-respiration switch protein FrsA (DUF1100 family)
MHKFNQIKVGGINLGLLLILFITSHCTRQSGSKIEGLWRGGIEIPGQNIPDVVFQIFKNADGVLRAMLESPDQTFRVPVDSLAFQDSTVYLVLKSMHGIFKGILKADKTTIAGEWNQAGHAFPLLLKRVDKIPESIRTQDPVKPYPYIEQEVIYENKEVQIKLVGTLSFPKTEGTHPAVLLIDGSGLGDRNDVILGQRSMLVLADHLTRQGIAVLTADKRGVWRSTGNFSQATTEDFASDVMAGVAYLKSRREINPKQIGLVGLSEGAMIATIVAAQSQDVAFIVEMAGPGIGLDAIMVEQKCLYAKATGMVDEDIQILRKWYYHFYTTAKAENNNLTAEQTIRDAFEKMPEEEREVLGWSEGKLAGEIQRVLTPWSRYLLNYDPKSFLLKVQCPVLALNGENDQQVVAEDNLIGIEQALKAGGNNRVTVMKLKGLNHNFQTAETGSELEYTMIEERIAPLAMQTISEWIQKQMSME